MPKLSPLVLGLAYCSTLLFGSVLAAAVAPEGPGCRVETNDAAGVSALVCADDEGVQDWAIITSATTCFATPEVPPGEWQMQCGRAQLTVRASTDGSVLDCEMRGTPRAFASCVLTRSGQ